jgi:hypothetical protein
LEGFASHTEEYGIHFEPSKKVPVSDLSPGIYYLIFSTDNKVYHDKLIIK